jgi:putative membrane protein
MRTFIRSGVVVLATGIATLALACGQPKKPPPTRTPAAAREPAPESGRTQRPFNEPAPQPPALPPPTAQAPIEQPEPQKPFYGPGTTPPEDHAQAKTEKPLSDAEVIGAARAANKGEVQMAELALKKATSPDVKHFASTMKSTHQKALEHDKKLQQKTKITSTESDLSSMLSSDAEKTINDLRDKHGKEFDRAYMESQVRSHKDVLTAIDNRLAPSAQNSEVKAMVTDMRHVVADHLAKAEEVQKKMESSSVSSRAESGKDHSKARTAPPKAKAKPVEQR